MKIYRLTRADDMPLDAAFARCLEVYQPPVALETIEFQMNLAIAESTDLSFIPELLRPRKSSGSTAIQRT